MSRGTNLVANWVTRREGSLCLEEQILSLNVDLIWFRSVALRRFSCASLTKNAHRCVYAQRVAPLAESAAR